MCCKEIWNIYQVLKNNVAQIGPGHNKHAGRASGKIAYPANAWSFPELAEWQSNAVSVGLPFRRLSVYSPSDVAYPPHLNIEKKLSYANLL